MLRCNRGRAQPLLVLQCILDLQVSTAPTAIMNMFTSTRLVQLDFSVFFCTSATGNDRYCVKYRFVDMFAAKVLESMLHLRCDLWTGARHVAGRLLCNRGALRAIGGHRTPDRQHSPRRNSSFR